MHELPLVFFTVFTQSAVGAFILLLIGGTLGQVDRQRMAVGLFSADVSVWRWGVAGHFPCRPAFTSIEYVAASGPFTDEQRNRVIGGVCDTWRAGRTGVVFIEVVVVSLRYVRTGVAGGCGGGGFYLRHPANLSVADGGHLADILHYGDDGPDSDDRWRHSGRTVWSAPGVAGERAGDSGQLLPASRLYLTLMDADGVLTAAQSSWFTAQVVLLAVGIVGVLAWVRLKTNVAVLATTSLVVIAAELVGRIAFYNLWTLPM